ncbi:hypothetical protein [Sodalinema gerasimenkoae]|nr:hypothetical protein [Sodalinema gerasimenkoae]
MSKLVGDWLLFQERETEPEGGAIAPSGLTLSPLSPRDSLP